MAESDRPKLTTIPAAEDGLRAAVEQLKRSLPVMAELGHQIAVTRKAMFDAHVTAGFTEAQALELCKKIEL